jgi:AcrR family transcriptional regulator
LASPPRSGRERARLGVDERRSQLLELGLQLFSDHSYDELGIDDIARAAGISKGLLYHYFPSKRDYYVEVVRRAAGQLLERTDGPPHAEVSLEALRGALDAYLDFVDQHARSYVALVRGGIGSDPEVVRLLEGTRRTLTERIVSRISADAPPPLLQLALRGWIGLVEAASLDWLDRREVPREQLRGLLEQMLLATIMAAGVDPPVL